VVNVEVTPSIEVPEKVMPISEVFKEVVHDGLPEGSPPMRDIQHHDASILYGFEDFFMHKKSARDESFKFFNFISPTISMWARRVLHGMQNFISNYTLKDLFHGCQLMKYGSIVYVYRWLIEEHQPIDIDYQPVRDDYIEDSMMQHYMEYDKNHRGESRF